jgi:hypothetical protein
LKLISVVALVIASSLSASESDIIQTNEKENTFKVDTLTNEDTLTEDQIAALNMKKNQNKSELFSTAESWDFDPNYDGLNIRNITISDRRDCSDINDSECLKMKQLIQNKKLVFKSPPNEECLVGKHLENYELLKKGTLTIGNDDYSAILYYNEKTEREGKEFTGIIIAKDAIDLLPEGRLKLKGYKSN